MQRLRWVLRVRWVRMVRWGLAGGALLLLAMLAITIGYGRYRAMNAYRRILAHSGVSISRDTNGVTYSQSVGGRKIFTLRAARETSLGQGIWQLHDAHLLLYTRDADHPDEIYGKEFEYDENQGIARALGEAFMDLQPPQKTPSAGQPSAKTPVSSDPGTTASRRVIHVHTSGLVYLRKAGLASTDQQVEFEYGGMRCTSLGAEFSTAENILHLRSHVTMDGLAHGQPVHITAGRTDLDRSSSTANLTEPVLVSQNRRARSDQAVLHLRPDGSIEQAQGSGNVLLSSGTQQVTSTHLEVVLSPQSVPQTARLSGGVVLTDTSLQRPMHGAARQVDALFNAGGAPVRVVATGAASAALVDHNNPAAGARGLQRSIAGETIIALLAPGDRKASSRLNTLESKGAARMQGESVATQASSAAPAPIKAVQVAADDLHIQFVAGRRNQVQPSRLDGIGHTVLQQDAPDGEQELTHGDSLTASFSPAVATLSLPHAIQSDQMRPDQSQPSSIQQVTIDSAVQAGHVTLFQRSVKGGGGVSTGSAQRATYDRTSGKVTLSGETELTSGNVTLRALTVVLEQQSGDVEARGGVQTTMAHAAQPGAIAAGEQGPVTHVLSATATFQHATRISEFRGSDADPARMWQGASQVQAAVLVLDGAQHTFSARPSSPGAQVHSVFAGTPAGKSASGPTERLAAPVPASRSGHSSGGEGSGLADDYVRVTSPRLDYNDLAREALFSGGVELDGSMGQVRGQRATVFLTPAVPPNGKAAPTQLPDSVRPDRVAAGAAPSSSVSSSSSSPTPLSGSLQRIVISGDVQLQQPGRQGTADQLLYTAASGSYVLTGSPGRPPHIADAQQGSVTGATLVFSGAGSTIVVAGEPATAKSHSGRVRTETEVRQ